MLRAGQQSNVYIYALSERVALILFLLARRPTLGTSAGYANRFPNPPTVPLTVLSRDEWVDDPSHARTHPTRPRATSPPTNPPSKPCEPTGRGGSAGCALVFVAAGPTPYGGPGYPTPPLGGARAATSAARRSVGVRPAPYGGPGCPAPPWGAGATFAAAPRRTRGNGH